MERQEILSRIQFQKGTLFPLEEEEPAQEAAAQVMRLDQGLLLVRVEDEAGFVAPRAQLGLEVPAAEALYQVAGTVESITPATDGMPIVALSVTEAIAIQRRKEERFDVLLLCRVGLIGEGEKPTDVLLEPIGTGRITDLSFGGIALETELELPVGTAIKVDVRLEGGRVLLPGEIVAVHKERGATRQYGIRINEMDMVSLRHLRRLILRRESERRKKEEAPSAAALQRRQAQGAQRAREPGRRRSR